MSKQTRTNQFNVEWIYANQCWTALVAGQTVPPVPKYFIWEKEENSTTPEKMIGSKLIKPQRIIFRGISYHG